MLLQRQTTQEVMELTDTDVEDANDVRRRAKRAKTEANGKQLLHRTGKTFDCFLGEFAEGYLRNNSRIDGDRFHAQCPRR